MDRFDEAGGEVDHGRETFRVGEHREGDAHVRPHLQVGRPTLVEDEEVTLLAGGLAPVAERGSEEGQLLVV